MTTRAVLCFLLYKESILLIRKKRGFGAGKINGVGGRVERGESLESAVVREVQEEIGVKVSSLRPAGTLKFYSSSSEPDWIVHVFLSNHFEGQPTSSDEAEPHWYHMDALPYEDMWEDDRIWLPYVLKGWTVEGEFWFDEGYKRLLRWALTARFNV
ncbi:MAG: 8-oxo-dGTP diphosphatase [Thermofilaceae archaeon]|nr:8-oxo-dGTP diphosphatase [Thermofilaceae archaeon]MCX8180532.1 8-oxo-dGTP diphosphatase [Thermofilaceae archaeon]MDW8003272.1 8-oxo-dGTP diphosphatase [Thermofilaceae archaeon]